MTAGGFDTRGDNAEARDLVVQVMTAAVARDVELAMSLVEGAPDARVLAWQLVGLLMPLVEMWAASNQMATQEFWELFALAWAGMKGAS